MASEKQPQPAVIMTAEQFGVRQLAQELQEMQESGVKPDETVPGGRYVGPGGKVTDAWGRVIEGKGAAKGSGAKSPEDVAARLRELEQERQALVIEQGQLQAQAEAEAAEQERELAEAAAAGELGPDSEDGSGKRAASKSARKGR
jgi:hypothetical protein